MASTIDMSCNILDDDELERLAAIKPTRIELRQWIHDSVPTENPFERGFIKSSYSFPKAFQNKGYSEEFPPLIQRTASVITTSNLLQRVKEKLEADTPPPPKFTIVSSTTALASLPEQVNIAPYYATESTTPPYYAACTPDYVSHTPPYPPY
jgi:hypothetical protein